MRVLFIHPDLGIGGAERLVVDAAESLRLRGHDVVIYTAHHDASHAFPETVTGGLRVVVRGDFLPRHFCGKGHVLCASVRNLYTASCAALESWDVVVADQVSTCLPLLRILARRSRLVFYCHFPDKLLARRSSWLRRLYRLPFDILEELTTACAHRLLVNSKFTASVVAEAFPLLGTPTVLYPSVATPDVEPNEAQAYVVSLNRYERKKRVDLAVQAVSLLPRDLRLVVAGGYDPRVQENVEYLVELKALASDLGVADRVSFEQSISDDRRRDLLKNAACLVYTPPDEHFGIVPLEAMALGCPVVAANSGGPLETVKHNETGFLVDPSPDAFAEAIRAIVADPTPMRAKAQRHVQSNFSRVVFADRLEAVCHDVLRT